MSATPNPPIAGTAQIWDTLRTREEPEDDKEEGTWSCQSLYVDIFQSIQKTVLEHEKFLFSFAEQTRLEKLQALSYPARYLIIRLCLCKREKWHSLASLEQRYKIEIGGKENISDAIDELCGIVHKAPAPVKVKYEKLDIIDLTLDEDEDPSAASNLVFNDPDHAERNASVSTSKLLEQDSRDDTCLFAEDNSTATLSELLGCLTHDELKCIGKQLKVTKTGQNRSALTDAILTNASNQSTLAYSILTPRNNATKSNGKPMHQLALNFSRDGKMKTQAAVVRQLVLKAIGRCIRITPMVFVLFDRLNMIFFRSTTHGSSLLLPAILTTARKRRYPKTEYKRSATIFLSRQALLDYEEALALELRIDEAFSSEGRAIAPTKSSKDAKGKGRPKAEEGPLKFSSRMEGAKAVREIWTSVYDSWKALVACKDEDPEKSSGLGRFDCGHILTRIVYKGAEALAILKEHDLEIEVLQALLAQTKWRKGHRGTWYDRLALVLMTHCEQTQETWEMAMNVVICGLQDELTHLTHRPRLERRLTRLEKKLKIPMKERHKCDGQIKKARDVYIEGVRVKNRASSVVLDESGRVKVTAIPFTDRSKSATPFAKFRASTQPPHAENDLAKGLSSWKGKTLWIGEQEEEISVEQFALEHYHRLGWKGIHSEGRIVFTIFGLLFWDVIFADIPGAFETPYQTAPLDIFEDSFYLARRVLVDQVLKALEDGKARELLEQVLDRESINPPCCIGVDWDFKREDLLNIVDCLGGHSLAIICQMICEDYGQWRGGIPDLLIWNIKTKKCRFVEVKSQNDTLQENQKVWIDVLIGSEASVDLCHVSEKGEKVKQTRRSRAGSRMKEVIASSDIESEDAVESEPEDEETDQFDQSQGLQTRSKKRARDADDFVPLPTKKRKREVTALITEESSSP